MGEARKIRTELRQNSLCGEDVDPGYFGQIHSEDSVEMSLQVEERLALLRLGPVFRWRRGSWRRIHFRLEPPEKLGNLEIARADQFLVMTKRFQRLAEREQMLASVVSHQRLGDGIRAGLDPPVAECRQRMRVALTRQDGLHDRYPGHAGDIADHVVELQVHLI